MGGTNVEGDAVIIWRQAGREGKRGMIAWEERNAIAGVNDRAWMDAEA